MMSDIEKALNIFNNITGKTELSCQYKQMLDSFNISESNGYIVKLKLTDEILSGKLNSNEVETRLNMILNRLSKFKSRNGHTFTYDVDMLIFLKNQTDNKIMCSNCGYSMLPIDKFCSNCGREHVPRISLFELLSGINSKYIKPGDILKFNEDNTVEITTVNNMYNFHIEKRELELLYEEKIEKQEVNNYYFKILILNQIQKYGNVKVSEYLFTFYKIKNLENIISELLNSKLVKVSSFFNIFKKIRNISNIEDNNILENISITKKGKKLLDENKHVLLYDFYIRDSLIDDIVEFENFFSKKHGSLNEIFIEYLLFKRELFKAEKNTTRFLSTYDLESYFYEINDNKDKLVHTLFKRFIININTDFSHTQHQSAITEEGILHMVNILTELSMDLSLMRKIFHEGFNELDENYLVFTEEESFNYLLRAIGGENVETINFDIIISLDNKKVKS